MSCSSFLTRRPGFYDVLLPFWGPPEQPTPPSRRRRGETDPDAAHPLFRRPSQPPLAVAASSPVARAYMEASGLRIAKTHWARSRSAPRALPPCADAMSTPPDTVTQRVFNMTALPAAHLTLTVEALPVSSSGLVESAWWVYREKMRNDLRYVGEADIHNEAARRHAERMRNEEDMQPVATSSVMGLIEPLPLPRCGHCRRTVVDTAEDPLGGAPCSFRLALHLKGGRRNRKANQSLALKDLVLVDHKTLSRGGPWDCRETRALYSRLFSLHLEELDIDPMLVRQLSMWVSPALRVLQLQRCSGAFVPALKEASTCSYSGHRPVRENPVSPAAVSDKDEHVFGMTGLSALVCTGCSGEGLWRAMVHFALAPQRLDETSGAQALAPVATRPLLRLDLADATIGGKTLSLLMEAVHQRNCVSCTTFGPQSRIPATVSCYSLQELSLSGVSGWTDWTWLDGAHFFLGGGLRSLEMARHHVAEKDVLSGLVAFLASRPEDVVDLTATTPWGTEETTVGHHVGVEEMCTRAPATDRRMWILDLRWNLNTNDRLLRALLAAGVTAQHFRAAGTDTTSEVSKVFAAVVTP